MKRIALAVLVLALPSVLALGGPEEEPWVPVANAERIQRTVFTVLCTYEEDGTRAGKDEAAEHVQPAFFIDPTTAVTSFAALRRAKEVQGSLDGRRKSRLIVAGADPGRDLALVRFKDQDQAASILPLEEDSSEDPLDGDHWTLYLDPDSPGSARSIALGELLLPSGHEAEGRLPVDRLTVGLGGCPVVDAAGRLAGLWQWSWPEDGTCEPRILPVADLRALASRFPPGQEVADVLQAYPRPGASLCFPRLRWDRSKGSDARNATKRAKDIRDKVGCSACGYKGYTEEEREVYGTRRSYEIVQVPCRRCEERCLQDPLDIWRATRVLAAQATRAAVPEAVEGLARELEDGFGEAARLNPRLLRERMWDSAIQAIAPDAAVPGRSIVLPVPRKHWNDQPVPGWGGLDVRWIDDGERLLLLVGPTTRNVRGEGIDALVVGTIAGTLDLGRRTCIVVERGIVVPIKTSGEPTGR